MLTMLAKLQELREEREEGFTLIELLVVILIIGILSAIAIPAFLNQRTSAVDSSAQSDLTNTAKAVENWIVKQGATEKALPLNVIERGEDGSTSFSPAGSIPAELEAIKVSDGTLIHASGSSFGYCLVATNAGGDKAEAGNGGFVYASLSGGLQQEAGTCSNGVFSAGPGATAPAAAPEGNDVVWTYNAVARGYADPNDENTYQEFTIDMTGTSKPDGTFILEGTIPGATSGSLEFHPSSGAWDLYNVTINADGTFTGTTTRTSPPGEYDAGAYINGTVNGVVISG